MRTALVTGGSRGIGRAIVERLAAGGIRVIVHSHRKHAGAGARQVTADLGSPAEIEAMFAELADERLDILVNNAGIWKPTPLGSAPLAVIDELIAVNLRGPFLVTQAALPLMNDGGRIVNVSSVAGRIGVAGGRSLYGATKAGLDALTRNWALELAPRGILVNAVAPGYVETDMTEAHLSDAAIRERALARHPLGRLSDVRDVAGVVAFLCSDEARFVTGQSLNCSGGFVV